MSRNLLRKVHRWIFIWVGVFMLAWAVSGFFMLLPDRYFGKSVRYDKSEVDYSQAVLSPAAAVGVAQKLSNTGSAASQVRLRVIDDRLLYSVSFGDAGTQLVDATNGESFRFTPRLAEEITRRNFDIDAPMQKIDYLTENDPDYPFGPVPVYRVKFSDGTGISYYLHEGNLSNFRSSPLTLLHTAITSLHELQPVTMITGNDNLRHYIMLVASAVSLVGVVFGVILTLPRRKTARNETGSTGTQHD